MSPAQRLRRLGSRIYQPQVKFVWPFAVIERENQKLTRLPEGYSVRSPAPDEDLAAWAGLLNEDGQFGLWTAERVQRDIVARFVGPGAATLMFYGSELVGCSTTDELDVRGRRTGLGGYLYLSPKHRGKNLAHCITFRSLAFYLGGGFDRVISTTDPSRRAALALYLAWGVEPLYDSLFSHLQWWMIRRRLARPRRG